MDLGPTFTWWCSKCKIWWFVHAVVKSTTGYSYLNDIWNIGITPTYNPLHQVHDLPIELSCLQPAPVNQGVKTNEWVSLGMNSMQDTVMHFDGSSHNLHSDLMHAIYDLWLWMSGSYTVFCLGRFCRARRPALFKKPKWRPALLTLKKNYI